MDSTLLRFDVASTAWTEYTEKQSISTDRSVVVPDYVNGSHVTNSTPYLNKTTYRVLRLRISCSNFIGGYVKVGGITLKGEGKQTTVWWDDISNTLDILQNYPNPFNSSTTVRFQTQKSGNVLIRMYTLDGAFVRDIVNEFLKPGVYSKNIYFNDLASGIYFLSLQSGSSRVASKILHIK